MFDLENIFFKRFKELRESFALTQKEIAQKLNVEPSTISMWESGKNVPDLKTLINVCTLFGVDANYFFSSSYSKINKYAIVNKEAEENNISAEMLRDIIKAISPHKKN